MHSLGDGSDDLFSIVASKGALDLNDKKKKNERYSSGKRFRSRFLARSANESMLRIQDRRLYK